VTDPDSLLLPDSAAVADLATVVGRAQRVDPGGAVRLRGHGAVLAVFVAPLYGGGGPTVLGLRTMTLAAASEVDVTVPLTAAADSCARLLAAGQDPGSPADLVLPADRAGAPWAGISPPRHGWAPITGLEVAGLLAAARAGAAEIAAGAPEGSGAHAVAQLRALVWGRALPGTDDPPGVPTGAAFAADVLGFVRDGDPPVAVHRTGRWTRLTTPRGYLLARDPGPL